VWGIRWVFKEFHCHRASRSSILTATWLLTLDAQENTIVLVAVLQVDDAWGTWVKFCVHSLDQWNCTTNITGLWLNQHNFDVTWSLAEFRTRADCVMPSLWLPFQFGLVLMFHVSPMAGDG
jgi:hypothetical protein